MDWTIDTGILYAVDSGELDAARFLLFVEANSHQVALDNEGHIEREYERCLRTTRNRLLRKWWWNVARRCVLHLSGHLSSEDARTLEGLAFHQDDWPFVAVCSRTESKRLVIGEDSDYTADVREFLMRGMGVHILATAEALAICDSGSEGKA